MEPPHPRTSRRAPGTLPRSRRDHRRVNEHLPSVLHDDQGYSYDVPQPSQQSYYQTSLEYPDAGLIDYGGLGSESLSALGSRAVPEAQPETSLPAPQRTNKHSRVQNSTEASFFADVEDMIEDAPLESRSSTRQSKRTRAPPKYESNGTEVDGRTRKVSKLQTKIMEGKAPKKGLLGPMGEVRTRADGRMEFRDAENPEWSKSIRIQHVHIELTKLKRWLLTTVNIVGNSLMKLLSWVNLVSWFLAPTWEW